MRTVDKKYLSILFKNSTACSKTIQAVHTACSINHPDVRTRSQEVGKETFWSQGISPAVNLSKAIKIRNCHQILCKERSGKSGLNALKYSHIARRNILQKQKANFGQQPISFYSTTQSTTSSWVNLPLWLSLLTRLLVFQSQCETAQARVMLWQDLSLLCQSTNDTGPERLSDFAGNNSLEVSLVHNHFRILHFHYKISLLLGFQKMGMQ